MKTRIKKVGRGIYQISFSKKKKKKVSVKFMVKKHVRLAQFNKSWCILF